MYATDCAMFIVGVYAYLYMKNKYRKIIAVCLTVYAVTRLFDYFV